MNKYDHNDYSIGMHTNKTNATRGQHYAIAATPYMKRGGTVSAYRKRTGQNLPRRTLASKLISFLSR